MILGRLAMLALRGRKGILAQLAQREMLARLGRRVILVLQALPERLGQLVLQDRPENKAQQELQGQRGMLGQPALKVILGQLGIKAPLVSKGLPARRVSKALQGRLDIQGQLALLAVHLVILITAHILAQLAAIPVAGNCFGTTLRKYQQHKSILITLMIAMLILIYFWR